MRPFPFWLIVVSLTSLMAAFVLTTGCEERRARGGGSGGEELPRSERWALQ